MLVMERNGGLLIAGLYIDKPFITIAFCRGLAEITGHPIGKAAFNITAIAGILCNKQDCKKEYCREFLHSLVLVSAGGTLTLTGGVSNWLHCNYILPGPIHHCGWRLQIDRQSGITNPKSVILHQ